MSDKDKVRDCQLRVTAGKAGGRVLKAVPGMGTRPTGDKVKEALFSMIGPYFTEGTALDLFAGTGALGIEALSRGMDHAVFVDHDRRSVQTIRDNLRMTGLAGQAEVYCNDALRALRAMAKRGIAFDLILLDPPYQLDVLDSIVMPMMETGIVHDRTVIVLEQDAERALPDVIGMFRCIRQASYGSAQIAIYKQDQNFSREMTPSP